MEIGSLYDDDFYRLLHEGSERSAQIYLGHLWTLIRPASVLDVGCGRGAWLSVCKRLGSQRIVGIDGHWNDRSKMVLDEIDYRGVDLSRPFQLGEKFDLAISLEVAEHLGAESADQFIRSLTDASDVVLFSAAFPGQGGVNHVNEQKHSYWARKFNAFGYLPFDIFRPLFWADSEVQVWYRQNTFLYVRHMSAPFSSLAALGCVPMRYPNFMDCVHPEMFATVSSAYEVVRTGQLGMRGHLKLFLAAALLSLRRRVGRT